MSRKQVHNFYKVISLIKQPYSKYEFNHRQSKYISLLSAFYNCVKDGNAVTARLSIKNAREYPQIFPCNVRKLLPCSILSSNNSVKVISE